MSSATVATVPSALYATSVFTKLLNTSALSSTAWPEYTSSSTGEWLSFDATTWTSAFLPATFYALHYRHSFFCPATTATASNGSTTDWLSLARTWSDGLYTPDEALTNTHDVGFLSWPAQAELSLGNSSAAVTEAVSLEALHLANRYSPIVGCTKSWDNGGAGDFEVIIDNMMNIELLMEQSRLTSNATLATMAISHANKTMENHVRADWSSFHVVDYSPTTGEVQWRGTAQGYSNDSTWSRGQSWGVYGFAQMYNYTSDVRYLDTSRNMAQWYLSHLPSSGVAYWDFSAPEPTTYDTSSSLIFASALLQLSSIEASNSNMTGSEYWSNAAITMLNNVVSLAVNGWTGASIVGNGTVNNRYDPPINNTGIVYGDYYFIEAGNRLLQLGLANCTDGTPAVGASRTALSTPGTSASVRNSTSSSSRPASGTGTAEASSTNSKTGGAGRIRLLWF